MAQEVLLLKLRSLSLISFQICRHTVDHLYLDVRDAMDTRSSILLQNFQFVPNYLQPQLFDNVDRDAFYSVWWKKTSTMSFSRILLPCIPVSNPWLRWACLAHHKAMPIQVPSELQQCHCSVRSASPPRPPTQPQPRQACARARASGTRAGPPSRPPARGRRGAARRGSP